MTRKSKRELQRQLAELQRDAGHRDRAAVYTDPETGEFVDLAGRAVDPASVSTLVVVPTDDQIAAQLEGSA